MHGATINPAGKVILRRLAGCGLDSYGWWYGYEALIQILGYYILVTMIIFQIFFKLISVSCTIRLDFVSLI
jgi:hypothetical protein